MKFSFDELDVSRKRIALAKTALEKNEVDAMIFFDGDRYGRKFANTAAFTALVLSSDKGPIIIAHSIEKDHAESESELEIVEIKDTRKLKDSLKHMLPRTRDGKTKVAIVPWNANFERVKTLQELNYQIIDASENILPQCLKKPFPEEIDVIRRLSLICDEGLEAADNAVEAGRREYEVAAELITWLKSWAPPNSIFQLWLLLATVRLSRTDGHPLKKSLKEMLLSLTSVLL